LLDLWALILREGEAKEWKEGQKRVGYRRGGDKRGKEGMGDY